MVTGCQHSSLVGSLTSLEDTPWDTREDLTNEQRLNVWCAKEDCNEARN